MPYVTCPTCSTSIRHEFSATSVLCEQCAADVAIPKVDLGPPAAPVSTTPLPPPVPPRGGSDVDDLLAEARLRRGREAQAIAHSRLASSGDFGTCRVFLRIASVGTWLFVFVWVGMAAFNFLVVQRMSPAEIRTSADAVMLTLWGLGGGMALGVLIHLVGQIGCCATPAPYHERAVRSLVYLGISIVAGVLYAMTWWLLESGGGAWIALGLWLLAAIVLAVSIATSYYSWMKYLHELAKTFGEDGLATQFNACMGLTLAAIALPVVLGFLIAFALPQLARFRWNIVFGLMYLVLSLWYAIVLGSLTSRIGRALRR